MYQHLYIIDTILLALVTAVLGTLAWLGVPFMWWVIPLALLLRGIWDALWHWSVHHEDGFDWDTFAWMGVLVAAITGITCFFANASDLCVFVWWQTPVIVAGACLADFGLLAFTHHSMSAARTHLIESVGLAIYLIGLVGVPFGTLLLEMA